MEDAGPFQRQGCEQTKTSLMSSLGKMLSRRFSKLSSAQLGVRLLWERTVETESYVVLPLESRRGQILLVAVLFLSLVK